MTPLFILAALSTAPAAPAAPAAQTQVPSAGQAKPVRAAPSGAVQSFKVPGPEDEVKAEGALTATITAFASGNPNIEDMDDTVVEAVKATSGPLTATLVKLGTLKSLEYKGYSPNGVWHYRGEFAHGQADLSIAFSDAGKIAGLWCNPLKG